MDPQGRLLLEQCGLALADVAGRLGEPVAPDAGVYVGVMHMEYIQYITGKYQPRDDTSRDTWRLLFNVDKCVRAPCCNHQLHDACSVWCVFLCMVREILRMQSCRSEGKSCFGVHAGLGVQVTPNVSTGNGMDFLIGRVSYTFGLTGPCVSTHTACSSSLVSTHLAVHGLAARDCCSALSAGVFLVLLSGTMAGICQLQVWATQQPITVRVAP